MPTHESPYHLFPDFDALANRLENLRPKIEVYYDRVWETIPNCSLNDARLAPFAYLLKLIDSTNLSFTFINKHLLPFDNNWWQEVHNPSFDSFTDYDKSVTVNSFNNAFTKIGFIQTLFSILDSSFRLFLRKLDVSAAKNATKSIDSVFGNLCNRLTAKPTDSDDLIKLLRLVRNTIHNNGVFYPENLMNEQVNYKGQTYKFEFNKPIEFVHWEFLIDRLDDVRQLFAEIIFDANIIGITDDIIDPFSSNRKKVTT